MDVFDIDRVHIGVYRSTKSGAAMSVLAAHAMAERHSALRPILSLCSVDVTSRRRTAGEPRPQIVAPMVGSAIAGRRPVRFGEHGTGGAKPDEGGVHGEGCS
jgi:hypothetical protein